MSLLSHLGSLFSEERLVEAIASREHKRRFLSAVEEVMDDVKEATEVVVLVLAPDGDERRRHIRSEPHCVLNIEALQAPASARLAKPTDSYASRTYRFSCSRTIVYAAINSHYIEQSRVGDVRALLRKERLRVTLARQQWHPRG